MASEQAQIAVAKNDIKTMKDDIKEIKAILKAQDNRYITRMEQVRARGCSEQLTNRVLPVRQYDFLYRCHLNVVVRQLPHLHKGQERLSITMKRDGEQTT